MEEEMTRSDVLIIGAGPTGLVLALWLTRLGVKVRIVDKTAEPGTTSRALAVQARTLELYRQLDLADAVVTEGHQVPAVKLWVRGEPKAQISLAAMGSGLTPYPFLQIFPQDEHERLLIQRLDALGVTIERRTELVSFANREDRVLARLRGHDGEERDCETSYVAGCDGARSAVREAIGTGFPGGTYRHLFYVADVEAKGAALNGELHADLDEADFLAVFPLSGQGRARLIGTVRDERADRADTLTFNDIRGRAIEQMKVTIAKVNWFSTYHVHHRVTQHFGTGRAFLAGDAAHIHSPAGGQGMNTGIGDAINLAWKLAAVVAGRAPESLLNSYETERIAFARRLVATTDQAFTGVTSSSAFARALRLRIVPVLIPSLFAFRAIRRLAFRTVSQTAVNYRGSALSRGAAGPVQGGDRLPWVKTHAGDDRADNFAPLTSIDWQVHVYGEAAPEVRVVCEQRRLPLHVFAWQPAMRRNGLRPNAVYLVRPDGYVALADRGRPTANALASYLDAWKLSATRS